MFDGKQGCPGAGRYSDFVVNVLDMVVGGFRGNDQRLCNLPRRETPRYQAEHFDFSFTQPAYGFAMADLMSGGSEYVAHCIGIKTARPHLLVQLFRSSVRRQGGAIRAAL